MQFSPIFFRFMSLFGPNILLSALLSNAVRLCSFLNARDKVLGNIMVLFFLIASITQYIHIISISQKLACPVQFHFNLRFLDLPKGIFQRKAEKQW
jgi:hypothetical protein